MLNQDVHKNLRRNKSGIRLSTVEPLPSTYIRPPGFFLVPKLLNSSTPTSTSKKQTNSKQSDSSVTSYYNNNIKNEINR